MRRYTKYIQYVLRHKWFVFKFCLELGVPLWIAILHDWDKFLPDELIPYARCFNKPDGSKQYVETPELARAWMLHQHRNKHHWQYWVIIDIPSHNTAIPLPKTDYLIWDRGDLQRVVVRNSGPNEWYMVLPSFPSDSIGGCLPMPDVYRREMLADWRGAGAALGFTDTLGWYTKNRDKIQLHPDTRLWIETQLGYELELMTTGYFDPLGTPIPEKLRKPYGEL